MLYQLRATPLCIVPAHAFIHLSNPMLSILPWVFRLSLEWCILLAVFAVPPYSMLYPTLSLTLLVLFWRFTYCNIHMSLLTCMCDTLVNLNNTLVNKNLVKENVLSPLNHALLVPCFWNWVNLNIKNKYWQVFTMAFNPCLHLHRYKYVWPVCTLLC